MDTGTGHPRTAAGEGRLEIVNVVEEGLGHSTWLVATDGRALVVDPLRDVGPYRREAAARGWEIHWVADTHLHADHVTGAPGLAAAGAAYLAPALAGIEVPHRPLAHGDEVVLAEGGADGPRVVLEVRATPGHTPDHLAYVIRVGDRPAAVLTGGSLMVGTIGRPDLVGEAEQEALARAMWHSLHGQLLVLPDDVTVHPTHGAGSFCSAPGSADRATTIGRERATNPLVALGDEDTFVATLLAGLGTVPGHFRWLPALNRRGAPPFDAREPAALDPEEVGRLVDQGAQVVDVRGVGDYAAGHLPGSLANPLRPQFAAWLGWLADPDRPLVLVTGQTTDRAELIRQCALVGLDRIAGEVRGGVAAWQASGRTLATTEVIEASEATGPVLDVREAHEFATGHVPGARNVAVGAIAGAAIDDERTWTTMCGHGERAATAASLLERRGHHGVRIALGGPADWASSTGRSLENVA